MPTIFSRDDFNRMTPDARMRAMKAGYIVTDDLAEANVATGAPKPPMHRAVFDALPDERRRAFVLAGGSVTD